jgi:hypothetical protein
MGVFRIGDLVSTPGWGFEETSTVIGVEDGGATLEVLPSMEADEFSNYRLLPAAGTRPVTFVPLWAILKLELPCSIFMRMTPHRIRSHFGLRDGMYSYEVLAALGLDVAEYDTWITWSLSEEGKRSNDAKTLARRHVIAKTDQEFHRWHIKECPEHSLADAILYYAFLNPTWGIE